MRSEPLRWLSIARESLPDILFEGVRAGVGYDAPDFYELRNQMIAVGARQRIGSMEYNPACVFVVPDESATETFSWLRTYAPEASPLSQFGRVVTASDWRQFTSLHEPDLFSRYRGDKWASVIVGEALAQGEVDVDLAQLPLSRVFGCFSTTMARTFNSHGPDFVRLCADRMRVLEKDSRFVRRSVAVDELVPIWSIAQVELHSNVDPYEAVSLIVDTAFGVGSSADGKSRTFVERRLLVDRGLRSDSIEERVIAFRRLLTEFELSSKLGASRQSASFVLAAASFLVGRGTSHEFLVRRISGDFPATMVWFGLLASLAGPAHWDPSWARAVKGTERLLRVKFDWTESVSCDICWAEFSWLAKVFDGPKAFGGLPKLMPKVLSVEVVPGAACQFRLAVADSPEQEVTRLESASREAEIQALLVQSLALAERAKRLLPATRSIATRSVEPTLGISPAQKTPRQKRLKRLDDADADNR